MEKNLQEELQQEIEEIQRTITPFLLKIVIIVLFTGGLLGFVFFLSVLFFHIDGSNFSNIFGYKDSGNTVFTIITVLQLLIYLGFMIISINLYKKKRTGAYLYALFFILFIAVKSFYQESPVLFEGILGLILLIFIMISWKTLK